VNIKAQKMSSELGEGRIFAPRWQEILTTINNQHGSTVDSRLQRHRKYDDEARGKKTFSKKWMRLSCSETLQAENFV